MPDKIEKEEMLVHATIEKAKEVIQEAKHLGTMENKDDVNGETVKVKRPNKNPKEEKVKNPVSTDDVNSGYGLAGGDSEWKAVLKNKPEWTFPFDQQYWDAQTDADIAGYDAEHRRRTGMGPASEEDDAWTREQLAGSSTEGPMYRNWHEGTGVYSPDRQGQFARNPQQIEESMPEYRKDVDTPAHVSNK